MAGLPTVSFKDTVGKPGIYCKIKAGGSDVFKNTIPMADAC
jgi:hypothetical protein